MIYTFWPGTNDYIKLTDSKKLRLFIDRMEECIFRKKQITPLDINENQQLNDFMKEEKEKKYNKELNFSFNKDCKEIPSLNDKVSQDIWKLHDFENSKRTKELPPLDLYFSPLDIIEAIKTRTLREYIDRVLRLHHYEYQSVTGFILSVAKKFICLSCKFGSKLYKLHVYAIISYLKVVLEMNIGIVELTAYYKLGNAFKKFNTFRFTQECKGEENRGIRQIVEMFADAPGFTRVKISPDKVIRKKYTSLTFVKASFDVCMEYFDSTTWNTIESKESNMNDWIKLSCALP